MEVRVEAGRFTGERTLVIAMTLASVPDTGGAHPATPLGAAFMLAGAIVAILLKNRSPRTAR